MTAVEPIADAVTGGVLGAAVEPRTGAPVGADGHTQERSCLNCGTGLVGDYCHACGQRAHVHRSLHAFGHDLLHGVFHFEGKIWRTLPMLAWRPGELTRRYIEGQRASFVSPIALFLFCVFLMFAVLGLTGTLNMASGDQLREGIENSANQQRELVRRLEAERAAAVAQQRPTADIDRKLQAARDDLQVTEAFRDQRVLKLDTAEERASIPPWLREPIEKVARNPDLLFFKLKTNAYKFSWMLIPLSVPFMWLLFPFSRRFRLYDHTIFVTYSLCFMTLLAVVAAVMIRLGLANMSGLLWLIPPFHMYRQLKGAYQLSRVGALWRTIALVFVVAVTTTLFLLVLLTLGIFD
ncbi:DUF3667 domain-containing protein [Sphingomonas arenae]|uniref:DUF3667 domain-containing protein n=1 Tax=Sphingomonas arenae TaxID=2812555 RepID=UPI0019671D38|nr:DUF3667 domain-containing protein [Sphingomonas arenae]